MLMKLFLRTPLIMHFLIKVLFIFCVRKWVFCMSAHIAMRLHYRSDCNKLPIASQCNRIAGQRTHCNRRCISPWYPSFTRRRAVIQPPSLANLIG